MKKYLNASVKEVLEWAEKQNFSSFQQQNIIHSKIQNQIIKSPKSKNFKTKILKNYLHQRGLSQSLSVSQRNSFYHWRKNLYAIGFENLSGGWELRNSFYKGSLLKKDISIVNLNNENQNETGKRIVVFEGFMDALSFVEMKPFSMAICW
jgi:hypothetical protein